MRELVKILFAAFLCALIGAPSIAAAQQNSNAQATQVEAEILFLVKFEDGSKFGTDEVLTVSLFDGGLIDVEQKSLAVFVTTTDANFGPRAHITGRFRYKVADFAKLSIPVFAARLEKDGRLIAINSSNQPFSGKTFAQTILISRVN